MVPDSIVLTFDVRLPPTTDLVKWEEMLLVMSSMMRMRTMMIRDSWSTLLFIERNSLTGLAGGVWGGDHGGLVAEDDRSEHDLGLGNSTAVTFV